MFPAGLLGGEKSLVGDVSQAVNVSRFQDGRGREMISSIPGRFGMVFSLIWRIEGGGVDGFVREVENVFNWLRMNW